MSCLAGALAISFCAGFLSNDRVQGEDKALSVFSAAGEFKQRNQNLAPYAFTEKSTSNFQRELDRLVAERNALSPRDFSRRLAELKKTMRPYAQAEAIRTMGRWEDPTGELRRSLFQAWYKDSNGMQLTKLLDASPDKGVLLKLIAADDFSRNWVATADFYSKIGGVTEEDRAVLLDMVIGNWMNRQPIEYPRAWLSLQPAGLARDLAARTIYLQSGGQDKELLESISSAEVRKQTDDIAELQRQLASGRDIK